LNLSQRTALGDPRGARVIAPPTVELPAPLELQTNTQRGSKSPG